MKRAAALCLLLPLCACSTETTELLPPAAQTFAFCPAAIDVFGPDDTLLSDCGGPTAPATSLADGYPAGDSTYPPTLAGQLQAALNADAALVAHVGKSFTVRACGAPNQWLSSLTSFVPANQCQDAAPAGAFSTACADDPAPVMLLAAAEPFDRCHGGGNDTHSSDDQTGYDADFAARLDAFVTARGPSLLFVAAQPEWTPQPIMPPMMAAEGCTWLRGDWSQGGLDTWIKQKGSRSSVIPINLALHPAFKSHSALCCAALGLTCAMPDWLLEDQPMAMPTTLPRVKCGGGSTAITSGWIQAVEQLLANSRFAACR